MATNNLPVQSFTDFSIITTLQAFANKPQIWPDLRKSYGMDIFDFDIINTLKGSKKFIGSETYTVQEELPPFRTLTMGAGCGVGTVPGGVATIVLDANDLDAQNNYYPQPFQEITLGGASHKAVVTIMSIAGTGTSTVTLTVWPKDTSVTLDATYIATGLHGAYGPAPTKGNESGPVLGTMSGYQEFTYYLQTTKSNKSFGDAEFARQKWITPQGKGMWSKAVRDLDMDLDAQMELSIHTGETNLNTSNIYDTSLATNSSIPIYGTEGIWNWLGSRGKDLTYTSASGFPIEYFYKISEFGESVGLFSGEWLFNAGNELLRTVEKSCKSYITQATGSLNELFTPNAGGGMKDLVTGFKSIQLNSGATKIILKSNHMFTNPYFLGQLPGFTEAAEVFPLMNVREKKSGSLIPNLHMVYRGVDGYEDRERIVKAFGGMGGALQRFAGAPTVLEGDISKYHALTEWGLAALEMWRGMRVFRSDI
jgi:hypothetical protein